MASREGFTGGGLGVFAAIALAITAPNADAAATRAEYVAQVDPICQNATRRAAKAVKGIDLPRKPQLENLDDKRAFRQFLGFVAKAVGRSNKAIGPAIAQIALVPAAPGDERVVALWVQALGHYMVFSNRAVRATNHGKLNKFFYYLGKAGISAEQANDLVDDWGFRYCTSKSEDYAARSATRSSAAGPGLVPRRLAADVAIARALARP